MEHHRRGELDAARAAYTKVAVANPAHFDALHLLGVVAAQVGQPELAVRMIALALQVRPDDPEALNSLASALLASGKVEAAEEALRRTLELSPAHPDALQKLGGLLLDLGRSGEALNVLSQARRVAPRDMGVLNNLGTAWHKLDCPEEAEKAFRAVLRESRFHLQAMLNLGSLLLERDALDEARALLEDAARNTKSGRAQRLLGEAHERAGAVDAAAACYRRALALDPADGLACSRLGVSALAAGDAARGLGYLRHAAEISPTDPDVLCNLARGALVAERLDEGIAAAREALRRNPRHTGALVSLAALLRCQGRFDEVERLCREALAIAPGLRSARLNLSLALLGMRKHEEAERILDAMLAADYGDAEAHWNHAIARLARGAVSCGWAEFDWRWRLPGTKVPVVPAAPEWSNTPLRGRRLRLWSEQGLGDQIVFLSMLPDLVARQAEAIVECDPRLVGVLRRSFPTVRFVPAGSLTQTDDSAACDYQLSLGSLARFLRPDIGSFPKKVSYLVPDANEKARWRTWLDELGCGMKVGISWHSHDTAGASSLACASLEQWLPVLERSGVQFVCLQDDDCSQELAGLADRSAVRLHRPPGLDQREDLDGMCALLANLDLVIAAPTTAAALAGALGVPTWQLNSGIDWQGLDQPYSPWQPSVRRFYKPWDRTWDAELQQVAADLERMLALNAGSAMRQKATEASSPKR